jgi:Putative zinc-finger
MPDANHLGELAELYALGDLSDVERMRAERHLRACAECARRVGEAEAAMLRLIQSEAPPAQGAPERRLVLPGRMPSRSWIAAVAAAFLAGLIPWGVTLMRDQSTAADTRTAREATAAMLAGHFAHAPFRAAAAGAPSGKVIYALRGGWIYAIVTPGPDALDVTVVRAGARVPVGRIAAGETARSAFVRIAGRVDAVELLERGRTVAVARLAR